MKAVAASAEQLYEGRRRLDASYHASDGVKALRIIQRWAGQTGTPPAPVPSMLREKTQTAYNTRQVELLKQVCTPNGIFIGGRSRRVYVTDPDYGIPFLSSSDMLLASFDGVKLVSKQQPDLESMILRKGWTLISRSGTIGNAAYVREDMDGLAGSEHIMRVVPDPERIHPGYVYAYLSSALGNAIVKSNTFGTVVDTIAPHQVGAILIPRLEPTAEQRIHELIEQAAALRVEANEDLRRINADVTHTLGLPTSFFGQHDHARVVGCSSLHSPNLRLDAYYYIGYAGQAASAIRQVDPPLRKLSDIAVEVFNPPVFKRIYVGPDGMPYFMGYEVYEAYPRPSRYLARSTKDLERYVLHEGMIIVQDAGQRYGLLGTPIYANRTLDGKAATNNMIRIVSPDKNTAGYLFAFLNTEIGRRLIVRESYGSSLPHILPAWLAAMPIPWPSEDIRVSLGSRAVAAFEKRARANEIEDKAQTLLTEALKIE